MLNWLCCVLMVQLVQAAAKLNDLLSMNRNVAGLALLQQDADDLNTRLTSRSGLGKQQFQRAASASSMHQASSLRRRRRADAA